MSEPDYECLVEVVAIHDAGQPDESITVNQVRISGGEDVPKLNQITLSHGSFFIMTGHSPIVGDAYNVAVAKARGQRSKWVGEWT